MRKPNEGCKRRRRESAATDNHSENLASSRTGRSASGSNVSERVQRDGRKNRREDLRADEKSSLYHNRGNGGSHRQKAEAPKGIRQEGSDRLDGVNW